MHSLIDSVTVFHCGALVTRVADLVADYPAELRLEGLPLSLEDDSLRAQVTPLGEGAAPVAADLRCDLILPPPPSAPDHRQQELVLQHRREVLQAACQRLSQLEPRPPKDEAPPLGPRRALIELKQERLKALQGRLRELDRELGELRRKQTPRLGPPPSKSVLVRLVSPEGCAPKARLTLTYRVAGARWVPAYAFRFDRDLTMVEVLMRASVYQESGEDWEGVQLSVSTSDPVAWKDLPELPSLRYGKRQPKPARLGWRPPPPGTEALYADYDRCSRRPGGLGQRLVDEGLITARQLDKAIRQSELRRAPLAATLVELGFVTQQDVAELTGLRFVDLDSLPLDPELVRSIPEHLARRYRVIPIEQHGNCLIVAMADPHQALALDDLRLITGFDIEPVVAAENAIVRALDRQFGVCDQVEVQEAVKDISAQDFGPMDDTIKVDLLPSGKGGFSVLQTLGSLVGGGGGYTAPRPKPRPEPAPGGPLAPGREHLLYGNLRMPGPDEPQRGHLQVPPAPTHPALLAARIRAESGQRLAEPPGYRYPDAVEGFDYLYPGEARVSLPSDGQFHSVPLLVRQLAARPLYVAVPRETPEAFRVAEIDSLPDLALPAGPADVYVGPDFLLATQLADVAPGGTLRLGMGVEQALRVVRNTTFQETTTGMMSSTTQLRHHLEVRVANRLDREVAVQVWERLPQPASDTDDIKIHPEQVEPPWEHCQPPEQEHEAAYRWSVRVGPREEAVLKASYVVEIPSKYELSGGNRREGE